MSKKVIMIPCYGYDTQTFQEIYEKVGDFLQDYDDICDTTSEDGGIPKGITDANAKILYYLLYAKFGNSPIANLDVNQFKYKLFSNIFQYGPAWEKRLEIQEKLKALNLTEGDLFEGSTQIYNHAFNPSAAPTTQTNTELSYINDQNVSKHKKNIMVAYSELMALLRTDVTEDFLARFTKLFDPFAIPIAVRYMEVETDEA